MKKNILLIIDGIINILLGIILLSFPLGTAQWIGLPQTDTNFYASILGAVLLGIGIALLIDCFGAKKGIRGLDIAGAIAINLCGAGVLLLWLLFTNLQIPTHGLIILWSVAVIVLILGFIELFSKSWKTTD
jgi:hypothetical protein